MVPADTARHRQTAEWLRAHPYPIPQFPQPTAVQTSPTFSYLDTLFTYINWSCFESLWTVQRRNALTHPPTSLAMAHIAFPQKVPSMVSWPNMIPSMPFVAPVSCARCQAWVLRRATLQLWRAGQPVLVCMGCASTALLQQRQQQQQQRLAMAAVAAARARPTISSSPSISSSSTTSLSRKKTHSPTKNLDFYCSQCHKRVKFSATRTHQCKSLKVCSYCWGRVRSFAGWKECSNTMMTHCLPYPQKRRSSETDVLVTYPTIKGLKPYRRRGQPKVGFLCPHVTKSILQVFFPD